MANQCWKCHELCATRFCPTCGAEVICECGVLFEGPAGIRAHYRDKHPELSHYHIFSPFVTETLFVLAHLARRYRWVVIGLFIGLIVLVLLFRGDFSSDKSTAVQTALPKPAIEDTRAVTARPVAVTDASSVEAANSETQQLEQDDYYRPILGLWRTDISIPGREPDHITMEIRPDRTLTIVVSGHESVSYTWHEAPGEVPSIIITNPEVPGDSPKRMYYSSVKDAMCGDYSGEPFSYTRVENPTTSQLDLSGRTVEDSRDVPVTTVGFSQLNPNPQSVDRPIYLQAWNGEWGGEDSTLTIHEDGTATLVDISLSTGKRYPDKLLKWEAGVNPYEFFLHYPDAYNEPIACRVSGPVGQPQLNLLNVVLRPISTSDSRVASSRGELPAITDYYGVWRGHALSSSVEMTIFADGRIGWFEKTDDGKMTVRNEYRWVKDPETVHGICFDMSSRTIHCELNTNRAELKTYFGIFHRAVH